jgi:hypothetical protein
MLAPTDAKAIVDIDGEPIALRLNFRSIALAEKHGIALLSGQVPNLDETGGIVLVKCLAMEEQPYFTEDHVVTMLATNPAGVGQALIDLFEQYGGKVSGNVKGRKATKP